MTPTQVHRQLALSTPLGGERLLVERFRGSEELGRMFEFIVTAVALSDDFAFEELLGRPAMLRLMQDETGAGPVRHFHGHIAEVTHAEYDGHGRSAYELRLVPWLWFLTRTRDCRVYQSMSVPEILEDVFSRHGFRDYRLALEAEFPARDYTVQYRESSYDFVQRLMEHEGIYYFWRHEEDRHEMVICDSMQVHQPVPGFESIHFRARRSGIQQDDHLFTWKVSRKVTSGAAAINSFDFEAPIPSTNTRLLNRSELKHPHPHGDYEVYDNPGDYVDRREGERYAQVLRERLQAGTTSARSETNARGIACGSVFTPMELPRRDQSGQPHLVTRTVFSATSGNYGSGTGSTDLVFECAFEAIPAEDVRFRPAMSVEKPFVKGPQTAMVTGPKGEEIHVDDHGRVKVQFHWDREGRYDGGTSCWIRVSQPWAGTGFGGLAIPRIGQEVLIEFLEGDPDRPVLTGRLYNASSRPVVTHAGREDNPARAAREKARKKREMKKQEQSPSQTGSQS